MTTKTIAQELEISSFPFLINNHNDLLIYYEDENGNWYRNEYDQNGYKTFYENSNGYWEKAEYDKNGNRVYFEDQKGNIVDNRPPVEITMNQISDMFGIPLARLKIKK